MSSCAEGVKEGGERRKKKKEKKVPLSINTVDLGYKNNGFWDIAYKCLRSRPKHSYFFVKILLI